MPYLDHDSSSGPDLGPPMPRPAGGHKPPLRPTDNPSVWIDPLTGRRETHDPRNNAAPVQPTDTAQGHICADDQFDSFLPGHGW